MKQKLLNTYFMDNNQNHIDVYNTCKIKFNV